MLRDQHQIQCCKSHQKAAHRHALCRTLQLEKDRLEDRLSKLKAESLLLRGTPVPDAAASSPMDTALHRALRNDKEALKRNLEVDPLPYNTHSSNVFSSCLSCICQALHGLHHSSVVRGAEVAQQEEACLSHCFICPFKPTNRLQALRTLQCLQQLSTSHNSG